MIDYNFPQILGEAEILNERKMLTEVQSGLMMQGPESVRFIVIHCTATRADRDYTVEQMLKDHKQRGFRNIGYHFYIRKSGELSQHRKLLEVGAHAQGYNRCSIGVCYEGGYSPTPSPTPALPSREVEASPPGPSSLLPHPCSLIPGPSSLLPHPCSLIPGPSSLLPTPSDTRTEAQKRVMRQLVQKLRKLFPQAIVLGHRDLPGVKKDCPCFDVAAEFPHE